MCKPSPEVTPSLGQYPPPASAAPCPALYWPAPGSTGTQTSRSASRPPVPLLLLHLSADGRTHPKPFPCLPTAPVMHSLPNPLGLSFPSAAQMHAHLLSSPGPSVLPRPEPSSTSTGASLSVARESLGRLLREPFLPDLHAPLSEGFPYLCSGYFALSPPLWPLGAVELTLACAPFPSLWGPEA